MFPLRNLDSWRSLGGDLQELVGGLRATIRFHDLACARWLAERIVSHDNFRPMWAELGKSPALWWFEGIEDDDLFDVYLADEFIGEIPILGEGVEMVLDRLEGQQLRGTKLCVRASVLAHMYETGDMERAWTVAAGIESHDDFPALPPCGPGGCGAWSSGWRQPFLPGLDLLSCGDHEPPLSEIAEMRDWVERSLSEMSDARFVSYVKHYVSSLRALAAKKRDGVRLTMTGRVLLHRYAKLLPIVRAEAKRRAR